MLFVHIKNFILCINKGLFPILKKNIMNPKVHLEVQFKCLQCIPKKTYFSTLTECIARLIFIAGRPKAALLFWFFGDFRCGALLFMVIHVIYKYKNK